MSITTIKPGDSYEIVGSLEVDGVKQVLDGFTITSEVRTKGGALVWACSVTLIPDGGGINNSFALRATPALTASAPVGTLESDIVYTWPDGTVETTPTFEIAVVRGVTA